MKSKIAFEIYIFTNEAHFLDVTVSLKHGKLRKTLLTKPTDSHFCLNTSSCHPSHVLRKIPKGQFYSIATYMFTKMELSIEQQNHMYKAYRRRLP